MNKFGLNKREAQICRLEAEGHKTADIILAVYGVQKTEENKRKEYHYAYKKMLRAKQQPGYAEMYKEIVREAAFAQHGYAMRKIIEQIDDENGWLAQNAAREVLNRTTPIIFGKEADTITVKIEGMPEIGTPDNEEESVEDTEE